MFVCVKTHIRVKHSHVCPIDRIEDEEESEKLEERKRGETRKEKNRRKKISAFIGPAHKRESMGWSFLFNATRERKKMRSRTGEGLVLSTQKPVEAHMRCTWRVSAHCDCKSDSSSLFLHLAMELLVFLGRKNPLLRRNSNRFIRGAETMIDDVTWLCSTRSTTS